MMTVSYTSLNAHNLRYSHIEIDARAQRQEAEQCPDTGDFNLTKVMHATLIRMAPLEPWRAAA